MSAITTAHEAAEEIRWNLIWCLMVLAVLAILFLPLRRWELLWQMARGMGVLWGVLMIAGGLMHRAQRLLRVEDDPPSDAFLLSNTAVGVVLLTAWGGYSALAVAASAADAPVWVAAILYFGGLLAAHAAFSVVSSIYPGSFYRYVNAPVALAAFILFAAWPAAARALFGWLA